MGGIGARGRAELWKGVVSLIGESERAENECDHLQREQSTVVLRPPIELGECKVERNTSV